MKKFQLCMILLVLLLLLTSRVVAAASSQSEIDWGRRICKEVEAQVPLLKDDVVQKRVANIGTRIAAITPRQDLPYTFKVLNNSEVNAFAVPGGFIYVCKGLLDVLPSDDEIAAVLAHELGHIQKRHSIKQSDQSLGLAALFLLVLGDRGLPLQGLAQQAILAGYSRADEREADQLGLYYSVQAGYNPYGMLLTLEKLAAMEQPYHYDLFADHPEGKARISLVRQGMDKLGVKPTVVDRESDSIVLDQGQVLIGFNQPDGKKTAHERAYDAAGKLYRLSHKTGLSSDRLYIKQNEENLILCYDDEELIQLIPDDGAYGNAALTEQAAKLLMQVTAWITNKNQNLTN